MKIITASTIALFCFILTVLVSVLIIAAVHFPYIYMIYILGGLLFLSLWAAIGFILYATSALRSIEEKHE